MSKQVENEKGLETGPKSGSVGLRIITSLALMIAASTAICYAIKFILE